MNEKARVGRVGGALMTWLLVICACGGADGTGSAEGASDSERAEETTDAASSAESPTPTKVEGAFAFAIGDTETKEILALNPDTLAVGTLTTLDSATDFPRHIWTANGELWVATFEELFHIDAAGDQLGMLELEGVSIFAADEGAVWVEGGPVSTPPKSEPFFARLDPDRHTIVTSFQPEEFQDVWRIAVGGGSLWVQWSGDEHEIERLDPDTLTSTGTITTEIEIEALAWGYDSLWAAGPVDFGDEDIVVVRMDADGVVEAEVEIPGFGDVGGGLGFPGKGLVAALDGVWLVEEYGYEVVRIDSATNTEVARINAIPNASSPVGGLHLGSGRLWLREADTLYAIDPATNEANAVAELPTRENLGLVSSLVGSIAFVSGTDG